MKKCVLCKSSGFIYDWPNGALSWGTVPCPECKMSDSERSEHYKSRRRVKREMKRPRVWWRRLLLMYVWVPTGGSKLVEHPDGWPPT